MTYCCEDCGFLFRRVGAVEKCPSCEGTRFRPATMEEEKHLEALLNRGAETRKGERT